MGLVPHTQTESEKMVKDISCKYHGHVLMNNRNVSLTVQETGKSKIKVTAWFTFW